MYHLNGDRPTVIRIRRDEEAAGEFVCIIEDDGLAAARKRFRTIAELDAILEPEPEEDPTYVEAAAAIVDRLKAVSEISR